MEDGPLSNGLWGSFVDALPVDGGSVSVISREGISSTVSTSDAVAGQLDALQLEFGEGPRWRAFRTGAPVLVLDATRPDAHVDWPLFGAAVASTGVGGMFSFPLVIGLLIVGVADLYSTQGSDPWSPEQLAEAKAIASAAAAPAVRLATRSASAERPVSSSIASELRREVHQATGVLVVQLNARPDEALARLEAYAFAAGRPVLDVARDVISRRIDLSTDTE